MWLVLDRTHFRRWCTLCDDERVWVWISQRMLARGPQEVQFAFYLHCMKLSLSVTFFWAPQSPETLNHSAPNHYTNQHTNVIQSGQVMINFTFNRRRWCTFVLLFLFVGALVFSFAFLRLSLTQLVVDDAIEAGSVAVWCAIGGTAPQLSWVQFGGVSKFTISSVAGFFAAAAAAKQFTEHCTLSRLGLQHKELDDVGRDDSCVQQEQRLCFTFPTQ